jgi:hypothetical protein
LRAYWLFDDIESSARKEGVIKAYDSAVRFIDKLQSGEKNGSPGRYLTYFITRVGFAAAIFISKVVHSSYGVYIDVERGKQVFNTSISIFKQCRVEDNDMYGRTTKVLAQLWSIHKGLSEQTRQPPRLSLKSRLLFSIVHDSLWQWREVYAGQPNNGAPNLPPPFMSPSSTMVEGPSPADRPPSSLELSPMRSELNSNPAHASNAFNDQVAFSATAGQQFLSPTDFGEANPVRDPLPSSSQDHLAGNIGLLPPMAMQFDMLFPDTIMGYADPDQTWLSSMR